MSKLLGKNIISLYFLFTILIVYNILSSISIWFPPLFGLYFIIFKKYLENSDFDLLLFLILIVLTLEIERNIYLFSITVLYVYIYIFLFKAFKVYVNNNKYLLNIILISVVYILMPIFINILSFFSKLDNYNDINVFIILYYIIIEFLLSVIFND